MKKLMMIGVVFLASLYTLEAKSNRQLDAKSSYNLAKCGKWIPMYGRDGVEIGRYRDCGKYYQIQTYK